MTDLQQRHGQACANFSQIQRELKAMSRSKLVGIIALSSVLGACGGGGGGTGSSTTSGSSSSGGSSPAAGEVSAITAMLTQHKGALKEVAELLLQNETIGGNRVLDAIALKVA